MATKYPFPENGEFRHFALYLGEENETDRRPGCRTARFFNKKKGWFSAILQ